MHDNFTVPDGFKEVSQAEFYAYVNPLDVVPSPNKSHSRWELRNRQVIGYTTPGYMCQGRKAYYLKARQ